jgi:hypothetical protein
VFWAKLRTRIGKFSGGLVVDARIPRARENGYLPDGVSGSQADPLRNGTILLLRFGKLLLGAEGFVALDVRSPVSEEQSVRREDQGKSGKNICAGCIRFPGKLTGILKIWTR